MSLYHLICGKNTSSLLLPMINHSEGDFMRYRDVFTSDKDDWRCDEPGRRVYVFTRTGGGNREEYSEHIEEMSRDPLFLREYDDSYDSTYMTFVFRVPEAWHADYDAVVNGKYSEISDAYRDHVKKYYATVPW